MAPEHTEILLKREDVRELIKSPIRPTLVEIGPIAKKMGITSALELWEMFDRIQVLWAEKKETYISLEELG